MRIPVLAGVAGLLALSAAPARAHAVGVSRGDYRVSASTVEVELVFARSELVGVVPGLDQNRDGALSAADVAGEGRLLQDTVVRGLEIRTRSSPCDGVFRSAALTEQDGFVVRALYRCPGEPFSIRLSILESLSLGHRHLAAAITADRETQRAVVYESRPEFTLATASDAPGSGRVGAVAWPLFRLGIQHILTGYDHLLFLFGLILVGGRLGSLFLVITAFTVAHSLTLGLAALGAWAPSPRLVEPAIALSIAYVGIENWFVRGAEGRWRITFPFGLLHGFGFAGALAEVSLPSSQLPLALASFNVGVEAGQLAVLALVAPVVLWLARSRWFAGVGVKAVSAAIALAGLVWFVNRLT